MSHAHQPPMPSPDLAQLFTDRKYRPLGIRYIAMRYDHLQSPWNDIARILLTFATVAVFSAWYLLSEAMSSSSADWSALLLALGVALMIDPPRFVWMRLSQASSALDELFTATSSPSHGSFCANVKGYLETWRTVLASLCGASVVGVLYILVHQHESVLRVAPGTVFFMFAGFWTGHSAYLITITGRLCQKIGNSAGLRLNQVTPIATAGLTGASRAMRAMAGLGLLMLLVLSGSLMFRYVNRPSQDSLVITVICVTLGFVGVTLIGLQSQVWLARPANEAKSRTIQILEQKVSTLFSRAGSTNFSAADTAELATVAGLQQSLHSLPESYNDHEVLSAYTATAFGIALQFVLAGIAG